MVIQVHSRTERLKCRRPQHACSCVIQREARIDDVLNNRAKYRWNVRLICRVRWQLGLGPSVRVPLQSQRIDIRRRVAVITLPSVGSMHRERHCLGFVCVQGQAERSPGWHRVQPQACRRPVPCVPHRRVRPPRPVQREFCRLPIPRHKLDIQPSRLACDVRFQQSQSLIVWRCAFPGERVIPDKRRRPAGRHSRIKTPAPHQFRCQVARAVVAIDIIVHPVVSNRDASGELLDMAVLSDAVRPENDIRRPCRDASIQDIIRTAARKTMARPIWQSVA